MSVAKEKKFVIRHTFFNVDLMEEDEGYESGIEKHFNVDWQVNIFKINDGDIELCLGCPKINENKEGISVKTKTDLKILKETGGETFSGRFEFSLGEQSRELACIDSPQLENYLIDGDLTLEIRVEILEMTGIKETFSVSKKFDESNKELSDMVLMVEGHKFYVNKMFLAFHSSYFKSLFFGNFDEAKQSEVELKDIDPEEFQNYLELIHGESVVHDDTVAGILKLADFFDSKTATRRCEEFLLETSQKTLKQKFELASKYKLDKLMQKCLSEIKTEAELKSLIPEYANQLSPELWKELLGKAFTLPK